MLGASALEIEHVPHQQALILFHHVSRPHEHAGCQHADALALVVLPRARGGSGSRLEHGARPALRLQQFTRMRLGQAPLMVDIDLEQSQKRKENALDDDKLVCGPKREEQIPQLAGHLRQSSSGGSSSVKNQRQCLEI